MTNSDAVHSPDADALRRQMTKLLEAAIAKLPESFRVVFMLREVEGLSVEETAEALGITRETVKTRLARARRELHVLNGKPDCDCDFRAAACHGVRNGHASPRLSRHGRGSVYGH
jgi:hypothetical protein